ncbi:uncharacterized protein TrAtP1_012138 [Trichoderma atroviride]|uniref:uncharacterized protein n=1 Tax=Hypocrea atroviridis TaxID=63577 RepID=UPI00333133B8|nr:hypothetical protein TrAtP1_012138 [Trichoderma atroviride]
MQDKEKTVMETAICSSITRAAGLGDAFWRANLRDVAVMAMSDQNQSINKPLGKGKGVTPVVPPSLASSSSTFQVQIKSEQNVMERLALEFSSLPDREMVPEGSDSAGQQQQLTAPGSSSQITHTSNTPTNNLITKTIRAAMSDINKPK